MCVCMCVCNVCGYVIWCVEHYRLFLVQDILWSPIEIESKKISMKHENLRHILNSICMNLIFILFHQQYLLVLLKEWLTNHTKP